MLLNEKIEIIKKLECDEANLILRLHEYHTEKYSLNNTKNVFENLDAVFNTLSNEIANPFFIMFSDEIPETSHKTKNIYIVPSSQTDEEFNEKNYYAGKAFDKKLSQNYLNDETKTMLKNNKNIIFVIDVKDVSTFPIWNTNMRRKTTSIFESIEKEQNINCKTLAKIIDDAIPSKITKNEKYDLDFLIQFFKEAHEITEFKTVYIKDNNEKKNREEIFFINEFEKFIHALKLNENKYDYIYDTLCSDMDTMFSKYGFCSFKDNKCISQRHKGILNNYPTPRTDGCCFKVINKCEHNNKDGTCKVKCLACKLFSCPYLSKKGIGFSTSELILMRAFLNNKQKRDAVYTFFEPKKVVIKKFEKHK